MGPSLLDGGHLTHGYHTARKKITFLHLPLALPYKLDPTTQLIDRAKLRTKAPRAVQARLTVCGAYPRDWVVQDA
ncbi:hypothetical protein BOTBODRAFT_58678 [Botryobasidium botryosum FD-172 SS1]|uniref:Serine hydroxymethyltransferase-like domain-containing protein n=1 Tax=Botryobasidium botryosum (strain FD-172 SS1) TaxID=930990 RepID=A0A067M1R8_BOTB1|nr:hypothetical protein BOTBODRAFT_58678 [Botryobasidium botryosum FD-172 SS1]